MGQQRVDLSGRLSCENGHRFIVEAGLVQNRYTQEVFMRMIVRTFLASVTLLASALPLQAQGGKAQDKPHAPCRVSGRVVSALDGAALKSSRVTLIQEGVKSHPKVFGTTTDSDWLFEIKNVTAGRYNFIALHVGYVDRQYK